ncbi:hypothetical protein QBC46DRAFT_395128 [Diplogelasinospora grovesii]|uniref:GST N-terminal domain-containing protein n=1 Tax=Diplogelasinospora grovesii TaxID=303347 RepID=A0AAN6N241_9PEZI|nr:hypothetical protein QBC46DRAFT_395128 [Diplogelasinospora grovesii]
MASNQIILFDLPSKPPCSAWSLNPWKTRLLLNYKGLDYKTEWLEYPNIKPTLEKHIPPNETGTPYTIPAIRLPDGTYMMDSRKIANYIEQKHPSPPVHLDSPYLAKLEAIMPRLMTELRGIYIPLIPKRLLNEASVPYWNETRTKAVGMSLDQLEKERGGDIGWSAVAPLLQEVTALLKENTEGPFFMGKTVSYADFVWAGFLIFCQRIGQDVYEEALKRSGDAKVHEDLMEAVKPWSQRNDH